MRGAPDQPVFDLLERVGALGVLLELVGQLESICLKASDEGHQRINKSPSYTRAMQLKFGVNELSVKFIVAACSDLLSLFIYGSINIYHCLGT